MPVPAALRSNIESRVFLPLVLPLLPHVVVEYLQVMPWVSVSLVRRGAGPYAVFC